MKKLIKKQDIRESYNSTIFTGIYKKNVWGGIKGEFFSGPGSHNAYIEGYANVIADFIKKNDVYDIVEIGCGDFNVSNSILNKLNSVKHIYSYVGYDVVKPLVSRNNFIFGSSAVRFICKDSSTGKIKGGDLLLIRQVLQHLNNNSIKQIVQKFKNYRYIIVTEHQASEKYGNLIKPNIDQPAGESIRLRFKSAVYLDKDPYNCNVDSKIFEIPQWIYGMEAFINTYLIVNNLSALGKP